MQSAGRKGGRVYLPYAFTEQGIYMLMTVLKGDLAIRQSLSLVRLFKVMKDHIIENHGMVGQHEYLKLSLQVANSARETLRMRHDLDRINENMNGVMDRLSDVVLRSEISPILLEMGKPEEKREYLLLDGQPLKSDIAYAGIYGRANLSIHIIDDYISFKTLHLIGDAGSGVGVTIISDNVGKRLRASDVADFRREFPGMDIRFIRNEGASHDRFIVLDHGTRQERVFHCGASSKDSGYRMTAITELLDEDVIASFSSRLSGMLGNEQLMFE